LRVRFDRALELRFLRSKTTTDAGTVRENLIKIGAKVTRHLKYVSLQSERIRVESK